MTLAAFRTALDGALRSERSGAQPSGLVEERLVLNLQVADVLVGIFVSVLFAVLAAFTSWPWATLPGLLAAGLAVVAGVRCSRLPVPVWRGMGRPLLGFAFAGLLLAGSGLLVGEWFLWAVAVPLALLHFVISGRRTILSKTPSGTSFHFRDPRIQRLFLTAVTVELYAVAFVSRLQRIAGRHGGAYLCARCGDRFPDPRFAFRQRSGWRPCKDTSLWPQPEHPVLTLLPGRRPLFLAASLQDLVGTEDIDFKPATCRRPHCSSRRTQQDLRDILILAPSMRALDPFCAAVEDVRLRPASTGPAQQAWDMTFSVKGPDGRTRPLNGRVVLLPSGWPAVDDVSFVLAIPEVGDSDSGLSTRQQLLALFAGVSFESLAPPRGLAPERLRTWWARSAGLLRAVFLGRVTESVRRPGGLEGYRLAAWADSRGAPDRFEGVPVTAVQRPDQMAALLLP